MRERKSEKTTLRELASLFLRLGITAFGGPAAHIALMQDEVVRRRKWMSEEEFLDLLGATNLIPGPNSTELAIHIGHARGGWQGLLVAGTCFILPAALIVAVLGWAYVTYAHLPAVTGILYGIKPAIIAVVLQALLSLTKTALKTKSLALLGLGATLLAFLGTNELLILFGSGVIFALCRRYTRRSEFHAHSIAFPFLLAASPSAAASFGLWPLFLFFLKVGSVLFGSGYVLLAFLRADLVERWHWLSEAQLIDAIAVGQVTPGPVFTTATFIGYLLAGPVGAIVATIGIFLPAFFFVGVSGPFIPQLRRSPTAGAFLDAVNVASLALMAAVTWDLARSALIDLTTIGIAIVSVTALLRYRVNATWLIFGGALIGALTVLRR